jgi:glycolate oxidase iron-sulfur subunit
MLVLNGCVQPALTPSTDVALARALDRIGISLVRADGSGCCGAISEHLGAHSEALDYVRRNVDAWWAHRAGPGDSLVRERLRRRGQDYGYLLRTTRAPTRRGSLELAHDPVEIIAAEWKHLR